ncbi:MAG: M23 family metallopeptidase [Cyclobacteriaceae bacterium]|nr:M23 family metallopeptidase [Cyclobacteriaceae bacterium]
MPYFFPIRPGEVNYLSGTMGEIRSTHFHAGIDIKTSGISGLPVYACKEGFVSRIRVSSGGYGHALYILHPGGETSVYGHLLQYREDIADYVRKEQYRQESFEVDLFPDKEMFKIKRGELIALSGNTGSSMGPHLHFEIRDEKQYPVNPLKYGFSEIKDDVAPIVQAFALKTFDVNSRIDHQFGRFEYPVERKGSGYFYGKPIPVYGNIGLQIYAYDMFKNAYNRNGIPEIELFLDDTLRLKISIDTFSFNETRHVINFYDYQVKNEQRRIFQKLYVDDGNTLPFYKSMVNRGILSIRDNNLHSIKIRMSDLAGNSSELIIPVKGEKPTAAIPEINGFLSDELETRLFENFLIIKSGYADSPPNHALIFSNRMRYELIPSYFTDKQVVYLWDIRIGMPDSISVFDETRTFDFKIMLPSNTDFNFYNKVFDIRSYKKSLYDTIYLEARYRAFKDLHMEIFTIGNPNIPLAGSIQILFKPKFDYSGSDKYALFSSNDLKNYSFVSKQWNKDRISILTRNLGHFVVLKDTLPPQIRPVQVNRKKVSFTIRDELSGIKKYEARINGSWLLMHYDPKQNLIWSEMLEPNIPIEGELLLQVEDNVGNITQYKTLIN